MTHQELLNLAKEGAVVQWEKSGTVEAVWSHHGRIWAQGLTTGRHWIGKKDVYFVTKVAEPSTEALKLLTKIPARKKAGTQQNT
jgi:hypothetical protein